MIIITVTDPRHLPACSYPVQAHRASTDADAEKIYRDEYRLPVGDDVTVYKLRGDWFYPVLLDDGKV